MATDTRTPAAAEAAEGYQYPEHREHPWRKQLYLKGRNMTVAHLV